MEFTLSQNNPHDTQIKGPDATFIVSSTRARIPVIGARRTSIRRENATDAYATIEWNTMRKDGILKMNDKDIKISEFLKRQGDGMASERAFTINGEAYVWKPSDQLYTLERGYAPVAEMERRALRSSTLFVSEDAALILDTIIATLIIVWTQHNRG